jgi:signal transduction histidine kinase
MRPELDGAPADGAQAQTSAAEPAAGVFNAVVAHRQRQRHEQPRGSPDLVAQLAQAIEAQRATQQILEARTLQQATIVRLGLEALASRDLSSTLDLLVREAAGTLGAEFCSVLEIAADRGSFRLRGAFGWPPDAAGPASFLLDEVVDGASQAEYTVRSADPVVCSDLLTERRFTVQPLVIESGAVSGMSVIVHGRNQSWGVVGVHTKTPRAFTPEDTSFLQAVANLMALAVERDRVERTLRQRNLQQAAVALLGQHALTGPHMDDLFAAAVRDVAATMEVEFCKVMQLDPDGRTLLLRAGVGWEAGLVGSARVSSGMNSQAGFTLNSQGPVLVTDLRSETRFDPSGLLHDHGVVSGMSVLVRGRSRPFGILGVHSRNARTFNQDDVNFLQAVANLLATAIERHAAEGELRRHRDDLEGLVDQRTALLAAANRELEAFSYTISHDLRAPLRAVNGMSKILQRKHGDSLPPDAKELLRTMADEAIRMGHLIDSILSLSRLGTVSLTPVVVDVSATATAVLETLQSRDPARKVAWTVAPGLQVVADAGLLRMLLENLLGNAWKFTGHTAEPRITVSADVRGFRVEDNGAGFDMAHARELFQPFHRLHGAEEFEGTGIGLATVSRIVGRHGGHVRAQGAPGQGAVFSLSFPALAVSMAQPEQRLGQGPRSTAGAH